MLLPACSDGLVSLRLLTEADGGAGTSAAVQAGTGEGSGGMGNSGGRGGAPPVEPRAGAGGPQRLPPTLCDGAWEPDDEDALLDAFNDALSSGRLCPRESIGLRRPLEVDPDLQWQAHAAICYSPPSRGVWGRLPRSMTFAWVLSDTASLEDAKNLLLDNDGITALCDEAERTTYRAIGVGHGGESWSVFISPAAPEDTRRDDMQKP